MIPLECIDALVAKLLTYALIVIYGAMIGFGVALLIRRWRRG